MAIGKAARLALAAVLILSFACGQANTMRGEEGEEPVRERDVSFSNADGLTLTGRLFGRGRVGVTLAHMFPDSDGSGWHPAARRLARAGYTTLALNFRGYGGSDGPRAIARAPTDIAAAAEFLQEQGARSIVLVGASMGGTASLMAAGTLDPLAIVAVSAPLRFMGLDAPAVAGSVQRPVLLIAARGDASAFAAIEELERALPNPETRLYEGDAHGTSLIADRPDAVDEIITFLRRYAPTDRTQPVPS